MAGHVEDTVPYPESGQNEKKHHPDRNDYRPETGKKTETESELDRGKWMSTLKKKNVHCWSSSVGQMDFAVCTFPFQPSSVTCHCFLYKT